MWNHQTYKQIHSQSHAKQSSFIVETSKCQMSFTKPPKLKFVDFLQSGKVYANKISVLFQFKCKDNFIHPLSLAMAVTSSLNGMYTFRSMFLHVSIRTFQCSWKLWAFWKFDYGVYFGCWICSYCSKFNVYSECVKVMEPCCRYTLFQCK